MTGKGDKRRKGANDKAYRENYPFKDAYVPKWKRELMKVKEDLKNGNN